MTTALLHKPGVTVKLGQPIEHAGETLAEVRLRRPRVADMMEMQRKGGTPADMELHMVSMLSGLPLDAIGQLDMQDYSAVQAALRGFTAN